MHSSDGHCHHSYHNCYVAMLHDTVHTLMSYGSTCSRSVMLLYPFECKFEVTVNTDYSFLKSVQLVFAFVIDHVTKAGSRRQIVHG